MDKFRCKGCNFTFEFESDNIPKVCPNCGKHGNLEREKSAEDLVSDL